MGTLNTWNFDGTDGAVITDTGLAKAGTGTLLYSTADTARGSSGGRATAADASTVVARLTASVGSTTMAVGGFLKTLAANPAAVATLCTARSGTSAASAAVLRLQEAVDGSIGWSDVSGTFRQVVPAASVSAGTFYYWDVTAVVGTATAAPYNGSVTVTVYNSAGTQLGTNTLTTAAIGTAAVTMADVGANSSATPGYSVGFDYIRMENDRTTPFGFPTAGANVIPTVTAGATVTMTSGSTANITATGSDSDGTISSFAGTLNSTSSTTTPTIGAPVVTGAGTANASVSIPISNLTPGDHKFNVTTTDNSGGVSAPAVCRIVYTSLNPTRRSVTLNGVTMTTPASGAPVDALNNQATVPVSFTTAGPPAAGAGVIEAFQPLDSASVPPNFGQYWAASDAVTPITVYVDLKFNGATVATATATLTNTTPVFVGRNCTSAENTAIGADRSAPVVASRFS